MSNPMKPFLNHQMLKQVLSGHGGAIPQTQNMTPGGILNTPAPPPPLQAPQAPVAGPGPMGRMLHRILGKQATQTGGTY